MISCMADLVQPLRLSTTIGRKFVYLNKLSPPKIVTLRFNFIFKLQPLQWRRLWQLQWPPLQTLMSYLRNSNCAEHTQSSVHIRIVPCDLVTDFFSFALGFHLFALIYPLKILRHSAFSDTRKSYRQQVLIEILELQLLNIAKFRCQL